MSERKPGRPPLEKDQPSASVCVRLPPALYDRAYELATKQRTTVSDVMRQALRRTIRDDAQP